MWYILSILLLLFVIFLLLLYCCVHISTPMDDRIDDLMQEEFLKSRQRE